MNPLETGARRTTWAPSPESLVAGSYARALVIGRTSTRQLPSAVILNATLCALASNK
jgi:hypothetical protein